MSEVIEAGHVYLAKPPLFGLSRGTGSNRKIDYVYDEVALDQKLNEKICSGNCYLWYLLFFITDSITKETLRVSGGVFMVRSVAEDTEFETEEGRKYSLRKGDKVAMYPPAIHKDPEIFENPDVSVILTLLVIKIHLQ